MPIAKAQNTAKSLPQIPNPITDDELYGLTLLFDEMSIEVDDTNTKIDSLMKFSEITCSAQETIMKILTDKGIISEEELKKIYLGFKNHDYGVTH